MLANQLRSCNSRNNVPANIYSCTVYTTRQYKSHKTYWSEISRPDTYTKRKWITWIAWGMEYHNPPLVCMVKIKKNAFPWIGAWKSAKGSLQKSYVNSLWNVVFIVSFDVSVKVPKPFFCFDDHDIYYNTPLISRFYQRHGMDSSVISDQSIDKTPPLWQNSTIFVISIIEDIELPSFTTVDLVIAEIMLRLAFLTQ